ncbi:MAG: hypothetical protein JW841_15835 [Deltaproteobacteria bacterium]|nr:hypothetical protein [Deltaproteobacteria bacterium]
MAVLLLELAIQGVENLPVIQLKLQPQANAFVASSPILNTFTRALRVLLVGVDDHYQIQPGLDANIAQAAVTLKAADGTIYRLGRDLHTGRARVSQYLDTQRKFELLSDDTLEVMQILHTRTGLCENTLFDQVFTFSKSQLLARKNSNSAQNLVKTHNTSSTNETSARIAEIEDQLKICDNTDKLEFELDGLQKQRFAIDDELSQLDKPDSFVEQAQANSARYATLPADFLERYAMYNKSIERREQDLQRWEEAQNRLAPSEEREQLIKMPRKWFWSSIILGTLAIAAALFLGKNWRYLALIDIPTYGIATVILWQYFTRYDWRASQRRRSKRFAKRHQQILDRDSTLITSVERILEDWGFGSQKEVEAAVNAKHQAEEQARQAFMARTDNDHTLTSDELVSKRNAIDSKIATIEEQLQKSSIGINVGALRAELRQLRDGIIQPLEPDAIDLESSQSESNNQLVADFTRQACDLWLVDPLTANKRLTGISSSLIGSISLQQIVAIELNPTEILLKTADGRSLSFNDASFEFSEVVYVALRLALVIGCDERNYNPVIINSTHENNWMTKTIPTELLQRKLQFILLAESESCINTINIPITRIS